MDSPSARRVVTTYFVTWSAANIKQSKSRIMGWDGWKISTRLFFLLLLFLFLAPFFVGFLAETGGGLLHSLGIVFGRSLAMDAQPREWHRRQPRFGNGFLAQIANSIGAGLESFEGFLDLVQPILLGRHQAQREFAVEIVGAGVGHMKAIGGKVPRGFALRTVEVVARKKIDPVEEMIPQIEKQLLVFKPVSRQFPRSRRRRDNRLGCLDFAGYRRPFQRGFTSDLLLGRHSSIYSFIVGAFATAI